MSHVASNADTPLLIRSVFLLLFFILISFSPHSLLFPANECDWSETLTQNILSLLGCSGYQTLFATADIRYSSKLFIALLLEGHSDIMSQPIPLQLGGRWCVLWGRECPVLQHSTEFLFYWKLKFSFLPAVASLLICAALVAKFRWNFIHPTITYKFPSISFSFSSSPLVLWSSTGV